MGTSPVNPQQSFTSAAQAAMAIQATNLAVRQEILRQSMPMLQPIPNGANNITIAGGQLANPVFTVYPANVGLVRRFLLSVTGTFHNTDGANTATITPWGLANLLQNVTLIDPAGTQRHYTNGIHLVMVKMGKSKSLPVAAHSLSVNQMASFGDNFGVITAPQTLAPGAASAFRAVFEIPITPTVNDLRGVIYLGSQTQPIQLQLTFGQPGNGLSVAAGADPSFAVYSGTNAVQYSSFGVQLLQDYLGDVPMVNGSMPVVPMLDYQVKYMLQKTVNGATIQVGQDTVIPPQPAYEYASIGITYNSGAAPYFTGGTDINNIKLQQANLTPRWILTPQQAAQSLRQEWGSDLPIGTYFFPSYDRPLNAAVQGNMNFILNPSTVGANPRIDLYQESFIGANLSGSIGQQQG